MEFNVYDLLVFEDELGYLYYDCVCEIDKESDSKLYTIDCNDFTIDCNKKTDLIEKIYGSNKLGETKIKGWKLKEVWTRTDENTYKKIWENK